MTEPFDGAIFVQMRSRPRGAGPFAPMLMAAGWAAASEKRWGHGWVVTPLGVLSPDDARASASKSGDERVLRRSGLLPQTAVTLARDLLKVARAIGARYAPTPETWVGARIPFVWQRHDAFQHTGVVLARRLGCPLVMAVDAIEVDEAEGWGVHRPFWGAVFRRFGELRLIEQAHLVTCVSDEVAASVERYLPHRSRDVVVIGNGVDVAHFRKDTGVAQRIRARLGIPDRSFVVGWVGSFRKFHGLDDLLTAFAAVRADLPEAYLLLVGHGVHRARLLALAQQLGIARFVKSPGEVSYGEIPAYISAMDAGAVLAEPTDKFHYSPLKLLEYQSAGLPVIASRAGGMARMIPGEHALMVEPGDTAGLSNAIREIAADAALRTRLAEASLRLVQQHSWDSKLDELVKELDRRRDRGGSDANA